MPMIQSRAREGGAATDETDVRVVVLSELIMMRVT
jgi:hypothetical protein